MNFIERIAFFIIVNLFGVPVHVTVFNSPYPWAVVGSLFAHYFLAKWWWKKLM